MSGTTAGSASELVCGLLGLLLPFLLRSGRSLLCRFSTDFKVYATGARKHIIREVGGKRGNSGAEPRCRMHDAIIWYYDLGRGPAD